MWSRLAQTAYARTMHAMMHVKTGYCAWSHSAESWSCGCATFAETAHAECPQPLWVGRVQRRACLPATHNVCSGIGRSVRCLCDEARQESVVRYCSECCLAHGHMRNVASDRMHWDRASHTAVPQLVLHGPWHCSADAARTESSADASRTRPGIQHGAASSTAVSAAHSPQRALRGRGRLRLQRSLGHCTHATLYRCRFVVEQDNRTE